MNVLRNAIEHDYICTADGRKLTSGMVNSKYCIVYEIYKRCRTCKNLQNK